MDAESIRLLATAGAIAVGATAPAIAIGYMAAKGLEFMREADERLKGVEAFREEKVKEANQEAVSVVKRAENVGKEKQGEIIAYANKKAENLVLEAKRVIGEERAKLEENVSRDAEALVRSGIERVLGKLPAEARDKELIHEALKELKGA